MNTSRHMHSPRSNSGASGLHWQADRGLPGRLILLSLATAELVHYDNRILREGGGAADFFEPAA